MNQKGMRSLTGSQLTLPFKNATFCLDDLAHPFSQPISVDSPYARELEITPDNSKPHKTKKSPTTNEKLAFLLDSHAKKDKKASLLSNAFKKISSLTSISPHNREYKLSKTFEARHITPGDSTRPDGHIKKKKSPQRDSLKELSHEAQLRHKYYLGRQFGGDSELNAKSIDNYIKDKLRSDSIDAKKVLGTSKVQNKDSSKRLKKTRKSPKASICCKDVSSQRQILNHLSYNFSNSPDTSLFMGGGGPLTLTHQTKNETGGTGGSSEFRSSSVLFSSPKHPFFGSGHQSQHVEFNPSTAKVSRGKNFSFSETAALEPNQKAYLSYNSSTHNWKQCRRKTGSTGPNGSSVIGKSFHKGDNRDHSNYPTSPTASSRRNNAHSVLRSPSRDAVLEQKDFVPRDPVKIVRVDNEVSREHFNALRHSFESVIGSYDNQITDAQSAQQMLKKIKQEYETIIEKLIAENQHKEDKEDNIKVTSENQRLLKENKRLQVQISELKIDQEKLQDSFKSIRNQNLSSPYQSGLPTEKRGCSLKQHDSPPLTKHSKDTEKAQNDINQLKQIVLRQQGTINALRKKEAKMLRLMIAIKKHGVDIEKIYNEEVKGNLENLPHEETIPTLNKGKILETNSGAGVEKNQGGDSVPREDVVSQVSEEGSVFDPSELKLEQLGLKGTAELAKLINTHNKLNPMLKNQLRLDFTALKPGQEEKQTLNNDILLSGGFHEEFMSKFDEFSLSWRQATKLQKNI